MFIDCVLKTDSFVAYVAFSSCPRGARGHTVVMVNNPFSDLPFFSSEESV